MIDEGYIKYSAVHSTVPSLMYPQWEELNNVRTHLHTLGLIGSYPNGIGYGNVSVRTEGNQFLISGSATGNHAILTRDDYCTVRSFDIAQNTVVSEGAQRQASSESLTHGAVYAHSPTAYCVIHVHSRILFDRMCTAGVLSTSPTAAFGTPELAWAIADLVKKTEQESALFVSLGHDEGIFAYASSIADACALIDANVQLYGQ